MDFIAADGYTHLLLGSSFCFCCGVSLGLFLGIYHNTIDQIRAWFVCPGSDN